MPSDGRRSGLHWMDRRVASGSSRLRGSGCFATKAIPSGTTLFAFGGRAMIIAEEPGDYGIQISREFVFGPLPGEESDADYVNHSCDPNLGFRGQVFLVALRDYL